jgi:hypothetical protein
MSAGDTETDADTETDSFEHSVFVGHGRMGQDAVISRRIHRVLNVCEGLSVPDRRERIQTYTAVFGRIRPDTPASEEK